MVTEVTVSEQPGPEQLEALLRLQEGDTAIRRLEHQLDNLPEQQALDEVRRHAGEAKQARDELRVQLDMVSSRVRKLEGEIDLLTQRRDDDQSRMYSGQISNPRELQALRAEVDSTERRISDHEDELLEAMEEREELENRIGQLETRQLEFEEAVEERTSVRDRAASGIVTRLEEARADRERAREELSDELLADYEQLRDNTSGIAVGRLERGMCTACHMELPRIDISELKDGPPLARCPECRRLLVVRV